MPENLHTTDAVVIGAGPVGLFTVFSCGMVKIRCHVVDSLETLGGQLTTLYPEKPIFDIPGHPRILAADLIARLAEQAAPFQPVFHMGQCVERLERHESGSFWLITNTGTHFECPVVILAAGAGVFTPNRPPLAGLDAFEGTSVFYHIRRREDFQGKRVMISGGGDSALDWALSLIDVAARVMVVHRRSRFRAAPSTVARLHQQVQAGALDLVAPYQLHGVEGSRGRLSAVIVAALDGTTRRLDADVLLPFFGLTQDPGPIAKWGVALEHNHVLIDPATSMTNIAGIFAVGDIATCPGKLKLILTGFAEATRAARAAHSFVHPRTALHFEHSTTAGVPT